VFGRLAAQKLSDTLGKRFFVNIVSASGNIGTARRGVAGRRLRHAAGADQLCRQPALLPNTPYDAVKDFDPVTVAVTSPMIIAAHPSLPAPDRQDLIALIKGSRANTATPRAASARPAIWSASGSACSSGRPCARAVQARGSRCDGRQPHAICIVSPAPVAPQVAGRQAQAMAVTARFARRRAVVPT
jgi:hypothetical protein